MKYLTPIFLLACIFLSCEKREDLVDPVPKLELVSIGPKTLTEYQDSLVIVLAYEDGNGDLGGVHPDSSNLFIIDNRIDVPFEFRIQELVPGGKEVPIKGTLRVVLQNLFLTDEGNEEAVSFDIYAKDRAGNVSNRITTEEIKVVSEG